MVKDIFAIKIYEVEFPNYESIQQSLLDEILGYFNVNREQYSHHRLFRGALSLEGLEEYEFRDLHKRLKHQEIVKFINHHIKIYWQELGYIPEMEPDIVHMWANLSPKGGNIIQHNHSPFEIAGTFYVNATPEMGRLALVNPNELILGRLPYYHNQESKQGRYFFDHLVEPKPGKLVLFPGWLYHKTQPNPIDQERIVLGINSGGQA
jgi:uncharacterized protein (TIGR02466 family)